MAMTSKIFLDFSPAKGATGITDLPQLEESGESFGSGYTNGNSPSFNSAVTCPGNILSDISRLEVLVGGTRAENNSKEIINEAAGIFGRLFQDGIMDIKMYREVIDELVNDNHVLNYSD